MTTRDTVFVFVNMAFMLVVVAFCVFFFTIPGNFEKFQLFLKVISPVMVIAFVYSVKIRLLRSKHKEMQSQGEPDIEYSLSFSDRMLYDAANFLLPIAILLLAFFSGEINIYHFSQAAVVFLSLYFMGTRFFAK
jgi:hypothetical protein